MKKTFKHFFCLFVAILCFGQMWADQTWDFTEMSSADKTAYAAATTYWTWVEKNSRYENAVTATNGTWTDVTSTTITQISGWKFKRDGSNLSASNIRIVPNTTGNKDGYFTSNNSNVSIGFTAAIGDTLKVTFFNNESSNTRGYVLTGLKRISDNATTVEIAKQTSSTEVLIATATAVELKCNSSKIQLRKIVLKNPSGDGTPAIDETAPTLSSSSPANSATGVAVSGTIVLTFSEAIASVDGTKFSLSGATKGTVAIDGTDSKKVNVPYSGAANLATVTLSVAADAVADAAGNKSEALSDISFTTVAAETPACPDGISISGTAAYTEGETIELTAALTAGNGDITYQWYKGSIAVGNEVGTGATFTKADCATGDAGNYFCVASKDACSNEESSAYAITVAAVSYCAELVPATSGEAIAVEDDIDLQTGSNGGTMTAINLGNGNLAYHANGLGFNSKSGPTVKVVLKHNMQVGTKLWIKLMAAGSDTRGLTLKTKTGSTISAFTCWVKDVNGATNGDVETFTYTVVASDGLEGTNEFQLARNNSVWLQSVKVSNCGEELCAATIPGDIEKGEASGGTGKIVLKVEEDGEPEDGDAWYWQSSASGEAKTDEYDAEDGKEVSAAGTYYLRSYNTADECWSAAKSVTVVAADLLTAPTATFSNGAYVVNASALDLSTLWSSNSNGTVTYALKVASDDASVTAGAFSATKAGSYVVTASQAATATYSAIEKEATITVTYPATGTATVSYALSGSTATGTVTGVSTISSLSSSLTLSTLTLSGTKDGYSGAIKGCTSTLELVENDYVDVQFTVADGYMFTPSAVTVQVNPFTATGAVKAVVKIMDDQPLVVASEVLACEKSTDNTATFASGAFTNKRFVETVHIRMYFYGPAVDKTFYIKSPISITGTVAEYAEPVGFEISTSATNGTIATSVSSVAVTSAEANDQVEIVATPSTGYQFSSWSIYETATPANTITPAASTASTSFTMPSAAVTVEATFSKIDYTVTYNAATNGSYTIKVGTADAVSANTTAQYGQTVTLAATPNTGYAFTSWTVLQGETPITVTNNAFTMPAGNVTISATFDENECPTEGTVYSASTSATGDISIAASTANLELNSSTHKTTVSGGKMYVYNGQTSGKNLITSTGFSMTNGNTYFHIQLDCALEEGDVISVKVGKHADARGVWISSTRTDNVPSSAPACALTTTGTGSELKAVTYTVTGSDEYHGKNDFYIYRATSNSTYFNDISITRPAKVAPTFTAPEADQAQVTYTVGDVITALSVTVATGTFPAAEYQWYRNDTKSTEGASSITGANEASYTPSNAEASDYYYYCVASNSKGSATSHYFHVKVNAASAYNATYDKNGHGTAPDNKSDVTNVTLPQMDAVSGWKHTAWTANQAVKISGESVAAGSELEIGATAFLTANTTFTAVWKAMYAISKGSYANGSITIDPTEEMAGETIEIEATANDDYLFSAWTIKKTSDGTDVTSSVSLSGQTTSASFTMPAYAVTVDATFTAIDYCSTFTISTSESGELAVDDVVAGTGDADVKVIGVGTTSSLSMSSYGLSFTKSGDAIEVSLPNFMTEGSIICIELYYGGSNKGRGLTIKSTDDTKIVDMVYDFTAAGSKKLYYSIKSTDTKLIDSNKFRIARYSNVYLKSIYVSDCGSAAPNYTRSLTAGRFGTICLPNGGTIEGAAIYEIVYKEASQIFFDEVDGGVMIAGRPYIFYPYSGSTELKVYYTDNLSADAGNHNGLYGSYSETVLEPNDGNYILYNNMYYLVNSTASVGANRAYIKLGEVPNQPQAPVPGRRRISMQVQGEQIATGIINAENAELPMKVMIDNRLYIIRAGKMYDMTGSKVK